MAHTYGTLLRKTLLVLLGVVILLVIIALVGRPYVNGSFFQPAAPEQTRPSDINAPSTPSPNFTIATLISGLNHPWSLAFLPEGGMLLTERSGTLNYVPSVLAGRLSVSGLPQDIYVSGQAGLFEVALAPDYSASRTLYLSYAAREEGGTVLKVARATLFFPEGDTPMLQDVTPIFTSNPAVNDNKNLGGKLLFMDDGTLLVSVGDFFAQDESQNLATHLGKVIRINADGSIPADNPFIGREDALPEIYSYGNRNVQGMAVNPETGEIWMHEHGPRGGDEVNILQKGSNYGWPLATYGIDYSGATITSRTSLPGTVDPLVYWTPSIAPSGMAFYQGDHFYNWRGDIFLGALAGRHLRRLDIENGSIVGQEELLTNVKARIREVRLGPDGYLYLLTDEGNGKLLRLEPTG